MSNERRKYPRIDLGGEASILLCGSVRNGTLMNLSPSGIQIECQHQLVEQLSKAKSDAGLYPDFELEFTLPVEDSQAQQEAAERSRKKAKADRDREKKTIKSTCNVSYCRRQRQDSYHLGLNFISLTEQDEKKLSDYLSHSAAA